MLTNYNSSSVYINFMNVLDKGFVELVDHMGNDLSVSRSARVMPDAVWRDDLGGQTDAGLIRYMLKHKHSTPFEHVQFTFHIKAPIFVFRQWQRHRTFSYNELSARYSELPDEYYIPDLDKIGKQSTENKQGRLLIENPNERYGQLYVYKASCEEAFSDYHYLLKQGWPRELARGVLPLSTYSRMIASVNLWNLMKFFALRSDEHAQYEIRVYSDAMKELIKPLVPVCMKAWENLK